jgi:hypothetical protein
VVASLCDEMLRRAVCSATPCDFCKLAEQTYNV